ncbi:MAG: hypothetical protein V9F01_02235 [Chitinophagaceae bacterium]
MKNIIAIPLFTFLIVACGKDADNSTPPANIPGIINITSPSSLAIYLNGTVLKVEGDMTDNNGLAIARVEIRNKTTNAILFQQSSNTGAVSFYRFLWNWTISGITTTTVATVKVIARDKYSNEVTKEVDVTLEN